MMTRSKDQSPKSEKRSDKLSIFYAGALNTTGKKRTRAENNIPTSVEVDKLASTGIPSEKLAAMFEQYTTFLTKKKSEGKGFLTNRDNRQKNRLNQIAMLKNTFANLREQQTFEKWQALLILLVQYRITVYTENLMPKSESTYGNALWAVQEHVLTALEKAHTANPTCSMLTKLMQYKNDSSLCSKESEEETKILTAAFGHYTALHSDHPQLVTITARVKQFITEIDQPETDDSLQISKVYRSNSSSLWNNEDEQELYPSAKVARFTKS